ncbi:MAG: hypothetical protein RMX96_25585 [Nostoc sp. ChiSLP02]|nr:hypothetical protein [Nostoc sp. DedSLP05]MDZ8100798.1 hypothetical protein [Nostoc sp. DedSLP01]MDZ8188213.1 hypothetical protein [Nostoc sp. ChiSLP02]
MTPLQRRQFGKLVAASFTSTVVADISSKVLAQSSESSKDILYALNLSSSSNSRNRENQTPPIELNTIDVATLKVLPKANLLDLKVNLPDVKILSKVNLPVVSVDNPLSVPKQPRAFFLPESDRITKGIVLADKTVVISTVSHTNKGYFNHLVSVVGSGNSNNIKIRAKKVLDFKKSNQTVESLLNLPNNKLLCLVGTDGIPPFTMTTLDYTTGKILPGNELALPSLPLNHRFANLCQDLKGNIFATETGPDGVPILIAMNLQEKAIITGKVKIKRLNALKYQGRHLIDDVKDLAFSSSGQLYALAADSSRKSNVLFRVEVKTGDMELVGKFLGEKLAFSF